MSGHDLALLWTVLTENERLNVQPRPFATAFANFGATHTAVASERLVRNLHMTHYSIGH